ncbi:MAG: heme-binding protein [Acidobacteriales bacterium]|nr:heme-binding protein [Terriglobales bacterium]
MRKHTAIALSIFVFTMAAVAQIAEKKSLNLEGARKAIAAAEAYAKKVNAPGGVIAVVDDGGNLIALERLDGTFAAGANISIGKARTAALFKRPTKFFEDVIKNGRTAMIAVNDFTPLQGGVPIVVDGQVIGAVGVSGAASAAQDEELANAAAEAFKTPATASAPVAYFPKSDVDDAFRKGAVLLNGDGRNYMVHASRRDQPGMAEVHGKDADVIHVLDGKATFVTGGSVVDPKTTATDEVRGPAIEGGETREIAKGDVVVVPAGVPHWFKQVNGPLLYYVVKVR